VVVVTALYVAVIGAPLPAVRAAAMLGALSLSRAVQRPTSPWAVLAMGVGLPLLAPASVQDLGYQLSAAGMVALVCAGALAKRWSFFSVVGWRGSLYRGLLTSVAATLLTAPLVAATFGRVSLVAPISNLVAVPVMAVLQPMLFLAMLLLPVPAAAQFVADAAAPLLFAFDAIAARAAGLPGAQVMVLADSTTMALAGVAAAALVVAAVSRFPGRSLAFAAACGALVAWRPLLPRAGVAEVHVLDVGQGDAIAVRTAAGRWLLFDAGRAWPGGDEGRRQIVPYLARHGGELVAFVLSHPHADHVGGAESTIGALRPTWYFDPGYAGESGPYRRSLIAARRSRTGWRRVRPRDSLVVDDVTVTFLAPDSAWADSLGDPNEASTVARVRIGDVTILLTGDAEAGEERWLLRHQRDLLDVDVLKVAHHGSNTSSTPEFLGAVTPRLAVVSVGTGNTYGHPNRGVMRSLAATGAVTLRTDLLGTVVLRVDGARIEVDAAGERWMLR
jgi:competence protein ComEC